MGKDRYETRCRTVSKIEGSTTRIDLGLFPFAHCVRSNSRIATTRMSSKGQVVIPEDVRRRLGLKAGSRFVVVAGDDAVVLKPVTQPDMAQFDSLLAEARREARRVDLKRTDIARAIREARGRE